MYTSARLRRIQPLFRRLWFQERLGHKRTAHKGLKYVRSRLFRVSTAEQNATRARTALDAFAVSHGFRIASRYVKHGSSTQLDRPELFRLLDDCGPGDVLLVEQVSRPSCRLEQAVIADRGA